VHDAGSRIEVRAGGKRSRRAGGTATGSGRSASRNLGVFDAHHLETFELFFQLNAIKARTFVVFPVLVAAVLWYLILCTILMIGQYFLERHFGKGYGVAGRARQKLRDIEAEQSGRIAAEGGGPP